jgi:hypothetical protein
LRIPRTSFCVTSLIKKDAPRTAKKPNAKSQSLSLEDPTPRPSPPAHPFLSPLHRCQTTKRRPTGDTGCQGKTHQRALPPSQFHSEPKGPGLYAGPHPSSTTLSRTAQAVDSPPRGPSKWEASTPLSRASLANFRRGIQSSPSALNSARIAAGISLESASLGRSIGASSTVR